jgi:DNA-binding NarL/FixJ family response regulator
MTITVLLADDHAVVREGLRMLLDSQHGMEVVGEVGGGREAVREAARMQPSVVLMDISMPNMSGIEATRAITESYPKTKVIILSMHSDSEYVHRALRAGASGYVVKASASAEVVDAVRAVSDGRRFLSESVSETVIDQYLRGREAPADEDPLMRLSSREREVLQLIVEGWSPARIADEVALSPKTVETYRSRMMAKLSITNIPDLVKFAIKHGLTPLDQ